MNLLVLLGAALVGALVGISLWNVTSGPASAPTSQPLSRLTAVLPDDLDVLHFFLSPDGRTLAMRGRP